MEQIAKQIMQCINKEYSLEESEQETLLFGIQVVVELIINTLASIIILLYMEMLLEGLIFFSVFIPMRTLAGGYHSDTYRRCFLFSCITLITVMVLSKYVYLNEDLLITLILLVELLIGMLGPIISPDRPVSKVEYILFTKRLTKLFVIIATASIIIRFSSCSELLNVVFLSLCLILITSIIGRIKYRQHQIKV